MEDPKPNRLPEERQFNTVLIGACLLGALFVLSFVLLTCIKSTLSPRDITANWFAAWGTWAGGLATAAAFVIAAFSISVAGAQARFDRREAARIREDNEMAQARLLVVYKVEGTQSISSLATYRIENRSKDLFFDVSVPFVDSPDGSQAGFERRTAELVAQDSRLHEFIPTAELLTAHRDLNQHEAWFTLVTVHTHDATGITFAVEYTDAGGRRWRQHLGGQIERVLTTAAIPVREPDRFQPLQQIRRLSNVESWRLGRSFAQNVERPQTDDDFLETIEAFKVMHWKPIERVNDIAMEHSGKGEQRAETSVAVTFKPSAPPFWADHFRDKLAESGLCYGGGSADGRSQTDSFRCTPAVAAAASNELIDAAITYANDRFEQNELSAARRALDVRRQRH
jgi:hypothetical protein